MNEGHYRIGIIGAGGWGTTLAITLAGNKHECLLWTHDHHLANEINNTHENTIFLPGVNISKNIPTTTEPADLKDTDMIVIAVPTQYIRSVFDLNYFPDIKNKTILSVTKGIEKHTLLRISELLIEILGIRSEQFVVLTGPSHAEEVARKTPTTVVAASEDIDTAKLIQSIFMTPYLRVYTSDDVIGCELGGSLKNVIAIAAGIIDGLELGDNTKAALITRGLAEISRLGVALGANSTTFQGLSGLGDLLVTCNSRHSRNRHVGEEIGKGKSLEEIVNSTLMIAEGIETTESAYFLSRRHNVEMPITEQMYNILFKSEKPLAAIKNLMNRQSKREWWW